MQHIVDGISINIEPRHLAIIQKILEQCPYPVYVYGSRVKHTNKPFSDIDMCVMGPIDLRGLGILQAEFDESDLPFFVDLKSWASFDKSFQESIKKDLYLIKK